MDYCDLDVSRMSQLISSASLVQDDCVLAPSGVTLADCQDVFPRWQVAEIDRSDQRLCGSVPCRRAHCVNNRLTELVSELNRVQAILHTNRKVDAEIEQCPSQMWGDWFIGRLFSVRPLYRPVSEIEHGFDGAVGGWCATVSF